MPSSRKNITALGTVALLVSTLLGVSAPSAAAAPTITNDCFESVPDRHSTAPVSICYTVFQPIGADADRPAPAVIHSHGWGGTRVQDAAFFTDYLDHGIGVITFDQRGHGDSGGSAHIQDPEFEGQDLLRLLETVAELPWIQLDAPGDPRLGTIGGSYGGAYQYLAAFEQIHATGSTVIDAMAPGGTWYDLNESLAPSRLVRTQWATLLGTLGGMNMEPAAGSSFLTASITGKWPDGSLPGTIDLHEYVARNGAAWQVERGLKIDVPMVIASGATDNLFPLQQGLRAWENALTDQARADSLFIGFNGGHALPANQPQGFGVAGDPCSVQLGSDDFNGVIARFMHQELKGSSTGLSGFGDVHLATAGGRCQTVHSVTPSTVVELDESLDTELGTRVVHIVDGPVTVAGRTTVQAAVTTNFRDTFAFYALAVGTSASDARIVQNNMIPLRETEKVVGQAREFELPSVAVDVPEGQSLFLLTTPIQDMFTGASTLLKGAMKLRDISIHLPVVE